jgi:DNA topoisomerase-3
MVAEQANDGRWGQHAQKILDGPMWKPPADGGHNDQAHPPIHPTKYSSGENDWSPEKKKLYEFIVRSFLATCSKPAVGKETKISIVIGDEAFQATGHTTSC